MATELIEDRAGTIYLVPDCRPSSATVSWFEPDSSTALTSGSATIGADPSMSGPWNIDTVTSQTEITLNGSNPFKPDTEATRWAWLQAVDGWGSKVRIGEKLSSFQLQLAAPPPGTIEVNDDIHNLTCVFEVGSSYTAERKLNYRAEWTITCADTGEVKKYTTMHHVVRHQFQDACTPDMAKRYMSTAYPSYCTGLDFGYFQDIAERASNRVRLRIQATGAYPHLVGDGEAFRLDVGIHSLRVELAREGLYPAGYDPSLYTKDQERALSRSIHDALRAMQWYDADDSGTVEAREVRSAYTVHAIRE